MKQILFVCKHNIFRSRIAEILFNKLNHNKGYIANSAGVIKWDKKHLNGDTGFDAEKKVANKLNINLKVESKGISSRILKSTDILIIVADDVPPSIFRNEKAFSGEIIVWKIRDVKQKDKNKEFVASKTIKFIEKRVKELVKRLA